MPRYHLTPIPTPTPTLTLTPRRGVGKPFLPLLPSRPLRSKEGPTFSKAYRNAISLGSLPLPRRGSTPHVMTCTMINNKNNNNNNVMRKVVEFVYRVPKLINFAGEFTATIGFFLFFLQILCWTCCLDHVNHVYEHCTTSLSPSKALQVLQKQ
jgi:hypothetical protein